MTKRERFLAFANFEPVDRVPRHADYVDALRKTLIEYLGEDPSDHFETDRGMMYWPCPPDGYVAPDYTVYHEDCMGKEGFTIDENGCGHLGHGFHHFTEYISPLRNATTLNEIEAYPFPDRSTWIDDRLQWAAKGAHEAGNFAWIFVGHIYENAWQVRGYEPFLMDLATQRDWAEFVLDKFCDNSLMAAVAAAQAGYDCIMTGDDVANQNSMMFHPDLWREVMKPRWAKVIAAARDIKPDIHVWYHSDGNVWDILDDLVEIGITILNPVQPECIDPIAVRKRMGKRLAFDGCIGTQTTFPFGTPDSMRRTVLDLSEALDARNGGLMLSPTHVLEPEVPPENICAFFEACDELDWKSSEPRGAASPPTASMQTHNVLTVPPSVALPRQSRAMLDIPFGRARLCRDAGERSDLGMPYADDRAYARIQVNTFLLGDGKLNPRTAALRLLQPGPAPVEDAWIQEVGVRDESSFARQIGEAGHGLPGPG